MFLNGISFVSLIVIGHPQITQMPQIKKQNLLRSLCNLRISFANSFRAPSTANRSAHLARNDLGLSKHSEKISAKNFMNVLFAVTALEQLISNVRQHRNVA